MEDTRRFFVPPLAPTLYICIPKGDPVVYEQEGVSLEPEKLRDYVVQGELLTYFVVVSFDKFRKEQAGCGAASSSVGLFEQLTTVFKRLRLVTKFKQGKDVLPVIAHCRVVAHTRTLPEQLQVTDATTRKEFGIGTPDTMTPSASASEVPSEFSRSATPAPVDGVDLTDSVYDQAEQEAYASLSKINRKLPLSPVVPLDPSVALTLPNGDLYYKLTTRVNLAEKFIGSSIAMTVEVALKDEAMDVPSLLSRLTTTDAKPLPALNAHTIFSLVDPLKIGFSSSTSHMDQFVTVTLENMFNEPIIIGAASLHFALTEVSKRAVVDMDKLFAARILPHEPLPLTLAPQEVFSFVIALHASPLGSVEEVTSRKHIHPSLLLAWRPLVTPLYLISQFSVPFPTPQAEQLLLTVSVPQMPLALNRMFDLSVSLTNLASYPRSLAVELPFPEIKTLWAEGIRTFASGHLSTSSLSVEERVLTNEETLTQALIKARSQEMSILCIERHVHLGRAEPKGELTAKIRCIAAQTGIFALEGIKVLDKHNREEIRTYVIDTPVELSVTAQESLVAGFGLEESSPQHDEPFSLRFSVPDVENDTKVELDFP